MSIADEFAGYKAGLAGQPMPGIVSAAFDRGWYLGQQARRITEKKEGFKRGDIVEVTRGAYAGSRWVVAGTIDTLTKGEPRVIAGLESLPGLLHILSPDQLKLITSDEP